MNVKVTTKNGDISMPWWAWGVVSTAFLILFGGATGSALRLFAAVSNHETRITVNESILERQRQDIQEIKHTTQEILRELRRQK